MTSQGADEKFAGTSAAGGEKTKNGQGDKGGGTADQQRGEERIQLKVVVIS